jgi:hypothetical protein
MIRTMRNPWGELPSEPPYVLAADRPHVEVFNAQLGDGDFRLELGMMPEPFMGNRDAPLLMLNRNPGAGPGDIDVHRADRRYVAALRANLGPNPDDHLMVALRSEFSHTPAGAWMRKNFRELLEWVPSPEVLARRMLSVEFHGYHSKSWRSIGVTLPSQSYGFWLVERAIARAATIVIARGRRDWEIAVPALHNYGRIVTLRSSQCSAVSERNCGAEGFGQIVAALS